MTTIDPLVVAAEFRDAAAPCVATAASQARTVTVQLHIDPRDAQRTLDSIAELIAAGDVHAASLTVTA